MNYSDIICEITSKGRFCIDLGLNRISEILNYFGNPQDNLKYVHIAGSNGKGSVSAILSEILSQSGYKTALFTSPHIINYTERIKINNCEISQDDFARLGEKVLSACKKAQTYLTEFEILTAMAFLYFAEKNVDIVILETGLGGRLDATNIIKNNICAVITSISLEHKEILGTTIEQIAAEKAGIIKSNSPTVISNKNKALKTIKSIASNKNSIVLAPQKKVEIIYKNQTNYASFDNNLYEFSLMGLWQKDNLELALEVISVLKNNGFKISDTNIQNALKNVVWPARFQFNKQKNLIIDGCHNPDSALRLRQSLDFYFPEQNFIFIYGTLKNKDFQNVAKNLFKKQDKVYFYEFNYKNSAKYDDVKDFFDCEKLDLNINFTEFSNPKIITGSFYMINEIITRLKI